MKAPYQKSLGLLATGLFQITDITLDNQTGAAIITFASFDGAIYAVEASSDLDSWDELDDSVIGTGESTSFTSLLAICDSKINST